MRRTALCRRIRPVTDARGAMEVLIKLPVILLLIFIVASLFQGMYYLARDDGSRDKTRVVRALTLRIVLSLLLFCVLIFGYFSGLLQPSGA
jgi:hypothetical protein